MTGPSIVKKVELYGSNSDGNPVRYTVADGTTISKGILLKFADPRTASAAVAKGDLFAGISAMDKEADDGATAITVWTNGIFEMQASLACVVGDFLTIAANGYVVPLIHAGSAASKAYIVGYALEEADAGEVINVRVNV